MEKKYIKVSELAKLVGRTDSAIRKWISKLKEEGNTNNTIIEEPYGKGKVRYMVDKEFALKEFRIDASNKQESTGNTTSAKEKDELVSQLREEIKYLRHLLDKKDTELERERNRLDYLVKVLGEMVNEDLKTKKLN
ncbi:hypothetical protein V6R21_05265 [Limibacter armeniacum]|uniref:hypothetical protein n=1 Tax=Limibacter armeniacum TaxID=466084 RepID=UPI002FE5B249